MVSEGSGETSLVLKGGTMKHTQNDMFEEFPTTVDLDPRDIPLIKRAKQLYDYDLSITTKTCGNCVHRKQYGRKIFKCALFGFRSSNDKVCQKHREA